MINLNPEFCKKIKMARREAKLSQSVLAKEVGCNQSALSMFEQGDGTKLNEEVVKKLCQRFNVSLPSSQTTENVQQDTFRAISRPVVVERARGFCPNPACPSNHAYQVEGELYFRPTRSECDPVGGQFCAVCGELLERACPHCGASVHDGAICSYCGKPYVVSV